MYLFDGQLEPEWNTNLKFSTIIVAVMSCFRLALKAVIETCISQGAWIWVSGFRKGNIEARLEDFKLFDEAATGLWGSLVLIWRMKGKHLACVGAAIMILAQGLETFSSQIVGLDEELTPFTSKSAMNTLPAPPPPRAETWHNIIQRGTGGNMSLGFSTKAAIYDGIIAGTMSTIPLPCSTASCTWPPFPTLGVCGNCTESFFKTSCDSQNVCTYTMPSGTSVSSGDGTVSDFRFTVAPSNGSTNAFSLDSQAFFSIFDVMSASQTSSRTRIQAYECALWFCLQSLNVMVTNGTQTSSMIASWSKTSFSETNAHLGEYTFVDVPEELYLQNQTSYTVPTDSIQTMRGFMDSLMLGNASEIAGVIQYSSDWIEALQYAMLDLDGWISRLSLSMTNDIRRSGSIDRNRMFDYSGTAYIMASHVQVNWYWVVYPLTLMILAFCYLAQTVWRTARDQVCAWKGDSLPMLFCRVEQSIHAQVHDGMDRPEGLNDRVGRTEVELVRQEDGQWLFREPINH
ncbi:hypothetical protein F4677DRAFT_411310 [Hypoxylon crocopeplum]|nr:hypothetical protein F4677DRAFT_411310 [Hypoxylon crocopeplum]